MKTAIVNVMLILLIITTGLSASEIHTAVEEGNFNQVKELLEKSPVLLDERNERGSTPLLIASYNGHLNIVKFLMEKGADKDIRNNRGSSALNLAAYGGHLEIAKYLVENGLEVDKPSPTGFTPLIHAVFTGHNDVAEFLLEKGADITAADSGWGGRPIHWACSRGNAQSVKMLIARGANPEQPCTRDSSTPIFWATFSGNTDALKALISEGVSIQNSMSDGWTPLHNAADNGHLEATRTLIENGAIVDAGNAYGTTPLMSVIDNEDIDTLMVGLLLNNGADINKVDSSGTSLMHYSAFNGNVAIASFLVERGAKVNTPNESGRTPLHNAIYSGNPNYIQLLIDNGANPNAVDSLHRTALKSSIQMGHNEITSILVKNGADCNVKDNVYLRTPLHWAALKGNGQIVELMLNNNADINAVDSSRHTPLYYAGKYGHKTAAELLLKYNAKTAGYEGNFGWSPKLSEDVKTGEAYIWYLGHCGFAIKSSDHLLIFDYWNRGGTPDNPCLANGHINTEEIAGLKTYVFVTHEHRDHWDTTIYAWKDKIPNCTYIFGFKPEEQPQHRDSGYSGPEYGYTGPGEEKVFGDIKVTTIAANDAGVGFMVEVDGLSIYHAGDHAGWREGEKDGFTREIDFLDDKFSSVDMAFLNVTGCHVNDTISLAEGIYYTLEKLSPAVWFPTHGIDNERVYKTFAEKVARQGFTNQANCAENRGDLFFYERKLTP